MMYVNCTGLGAPPRRLYHGVAGSRASFPRSFDLRQAVCGYRSMLPRDGDACVFRYGAPLSHYGRSANVKGFLSGSWTMIIAVTTGVKSLNWLFTMYGGGIGVPFR